MNLFEIYDYKELIKLKMTTLKQINSRYTFEGLADAMKIHKPYLSKVLNKKGNFTEDQLFRCSEYLKLSELEKNYLELLFRENNTFVPERKTRINVELDKIRKKALKSSSIYSDFEKADSTHDTNTYFIDPYYAIIHMHLLVPKFRENTDLIAAKLNLSRDRVFEYLENLHLMRIILKKGKDIKVLKEFIHLPENSSLITAFRNLSKFKAIEKISQIPSDDYLSLHVFLTADENSRNKIQKLFLEFLTEAKKIADKAKPEDVFQLNFDLLKWS